MSKGNALLIQKIRWIYIPSPFLLAVLLLAASCKHQQPTPPAESRFTKIALAENLDEPIQFDILKDGRILLAERKGKVKIYNPANDQVLEVANIPVSTGYYSVTGEETEPAGEDGMLGIIADPNFDKNNWVYLYYSPQGGEAHSILARFELKGILLDTSAKKILLDVPNQRQSCCHLGGGMVFDKRGNLYLSTGDNTPNGPGGFANIDERPGMEINDAQRSSGNTNDLRGKILRIHPEADGTYTIPPGNLFPVGTPKTRPEIYTMGNRNPWRLSIDSRTGWLYWGEVGPGGTIDSAGRGPKSYDEFNQAREAGNFGWPYFIADNKAYWGYDYDNKISGKKFVATAPANHSKNNTGVTSLPPILPAFIWYPQTPSKEFPLLGSGSASAVGGPIYRKDDFPTALRPYPSYYEGKWFITDWVRGWIMVVTLDTHGNYQSMERFLPQLALQGPIDMRFGPDGDLYVLEYGNSGTYKRNPEARLSKITYNSGNLPPIAKAAADKYEGAVPLTVRLSAAGTADGDNDPLSYVWKIRRGEKITDTISTPDASITFSTAGVYNVMLTVRDDKGATDSATLQIIAGNEPPSVTIDLHGNNRSFFFPDRKIRYTVRVTDPEDGLTGMQNTTPGARVAIDYLPSAYPITTIQDDLTNSDLVPVGQLLANKFMGKSDCQSCHQHDTASFGPAFNAIAKKYSYRPSNIRYLADKIISGGSGVWGNTAMPPHPEMLTKEAEAIAKYILQLERKNRTPPLSTNGAFTSRVPDNESPGGGFLLRASYTDKGADAAPPLATTEMIVLEYPIVPISRLQNLKNMIWNHQINPDEAYVRPDSSGASFSLAGIDLTGIGGVRLQGPHDGSFVGWKIEIRLGSVTGPSIGDTERLTPDDSPIAAGAKQQAPQRTDINIVPTSSVHDLYFIFTEKETGHPHPSVRHIEFRPLAITSHAAP